MPTAEQLEALASRAEAHAMKAVDLAFLSPIAVEFANIAVAADCFTVAAALRAHASLIRESSNG